MCLPFQNFINKLPKFEDIFQILQYIRGQNSKMDLRTSNFLIFPANKMVYAFNNFLVKYHKKTYLY